MSYFLEPLLESNAKTINSNQTNNERKKMSAIKMMQRFYEEL